MVDIQEKDLQTLYLAGGCFWGLERYFQQVSGVRATHVGYAQSQVENPTYEEVCSGDTDAVETVEIIFDPHAVSLRTLVLLFLDVIDPYLLNRQGNDRGRQYRTGLYWPAGHEEDQEPVFRQALDELAQRESQTPVVEVGELKNFYLAEESHQNYLQKHPDGYCHISSEKISEVAQRQRFIEQIWALDSQQYRVTQEADTERPFENAYDSNFRPGLYVDRVSGQPLFLSTDKFDAGCGWPSFAKPIDPQAITTRKDFKLFGQPRIEVKTAASGSHLGHVFTDGPKELGGLRYCMNSAALRFIPKEDMVAQGYGQYLPMLDE